MFGVVETNCTTLDCAEYSEGFSLCGSCMFLRFMRRLITEGLENSGESMFALCLILGGARDSDYPVSQVLRYSEKRSHSVRCASMKPW